MPGPATLFQSGDHASRPAASAGCVLYWCTDHSIFYRSNGSAWSTWADISTFAGIAAHLADASDAHDASAVSVLDTAANFTGGDVEAVLAELQDNIDGLSGSAPGTYEVNLAAPVTVVNADTWYAGPAIVNPAAGTYLVIASLTMTSTFNGKTSCSMGIGTASPPTVGSGQSYVEATSEVILMTRMAKVTVNGSQTITAYGLSARGSSVVSILDTATSGAITDKASSITATLITSL